LISIRPEATYGKRYETRRTYGSADGGALDAE
jgi:hypothetical protein